MFTAGEINDVMTIEGLTNSSFLTADDAVSLIKTAEEKRILREGTEIHWVNPEGEVMFVFQVHRGLRLASEVMDVRDLIGMRGIKGVDAVVHVLSRAHKVTDKLINDLYQEKELGR